MIRNVRSLIGRVPLERALRFRGARIGKRVHVQSVAEASKEDPRFRAVVKHLRKSLGKRAMELEKGKPTLLKRKRRMELDEQVRLLNHFSRLGRPMHVQDILVAHMLHRGLAMEDLTPMISHLMALTKLARKNGKKPPFRGAAGIYKLVIKDNWLQRAESALHEQPVVLNSNELRAQLGIGEDAYRASAKMQKHMVDQRLSMVMGLLNLSKLVIKLPPRARENSYQYVHASHIHSPAVLRAVQQSTAYHLLHDLIQHGPGRKSEFTVPPTKLLYGSGSRFGQRMMLHDNTVKILLDKLVEAGFVSIDRKVTGGERSAEWIQITPHARSLMLTSIKRGYPLRELREGLVGVRTTDLSVSTLRTLNAIKKAWEVIDFRAQNPGKRVGITKRFTESRVTSIKGGTRPWSNMRRKNIDPFIEIWERQAHTLEERASVQRFREYLAAHPEEFKRERPQG